MEVASTRSPAQDRGHRSINSSNSDNSSSDNSSSDNSSSDSSNIQVANAGFRRLLARRGPTACRQEVVAQLECCSLSRLASIAWRLRLF